MKILPCSSLLALLFLSLCLGCGGGSSETAVLDGEFEPDPNVSAVNEVTDPTAPAE